MKRFVVLLLLASSPALAQRITTWQGYSAEATAGATASLTPDGPQLAGGLPKSGWKTLEVHADAGPRVKFLERTDGLRLMLYIDRSSLVPFTLRGAKLSPTPEGLDKPLDAFTPGMIMRAGIKLDEMEPAENGRTKVRFGWRWAGGSFEVTGYVMTDKIGPIYRTAIGDYVPFDPNVTVPGNFELLDAPKGKPFVVSKSKQRFELMTLKRKAGFSLVRTGQGAVGWLPTKLTKPIHRVDGAEDGVEGGVMGGVGGGGGQGAPTLPDKTPVYDSINGTFVGETDAWFHEKPVEEVQGWLRFEIKTRFGMATVWARKP